MNIYVGNLDFKTTEDELRTLFQGYGQVERVNIVRAGDTGQPRGFAFVEMNNNGEAEQAIAGVNGSNLGGRTLNVNQARPKTERGSGGGQGGRRSTGGGGFGRGGGQGY